jgi:CyaY protein
MTDPEYMSLAESLLNAVEACCDQINDTTDADIDNQRTGGMITLTFANQTQIVINLQKPLQEVWLATRSGGYHYKWDTSCWQDTKGQGEFFSELTRSARLQSRIDVSFRPANF